MRTQVVTIITVVTLVMSHPVGAQVRLAEVSGKVTDTSGGVLPGVTITATAVATGEKRTVVSEASGGYLMTALPVGEYEFRAELQGFAPTVVRGYRIGIGGSVLLNFQMQVAGLEESVTVQANVPLIDTTKSALSGKIDQTQVEELPVNGRNWLVFAVLAPGVKSDGQGVQGSTPTAGIGDGRNTRVFLDGAGVQNKSTGQSVDVEVSKEIIGEFEVITNRFDAQMGHAGTAIVNAVTKGGTDRFGGTAFGYFRHDRLNASDFFTGRVEPYQNRQYGGTFGGPLRRGQSHFFLSYERQVEPKTLSSNTGIAALDAPVDGTDVRNLYFARLDHALTPNHHLRGRFNAFTRFMPNDGVGGTVTTSGSIKDDWLIKRYNAGLDSVIAGRWVNQFLFTYLDTFRKFDRMSEGSQYNFPSLSIGGRPNAGHEIPSYWFLRNDVSYFLDRAGQHNIKFGGEYEHGDVQGFFANAANGQFFFDQDPANLATCCLGTDQSTWDISQFPVPVRYTRALGDFSISAPNDIVSAYFQDDWTLRRGLTLNVGVRYDVEFGSLAHDVTGLTTSPRTNDVNNFQPRLGFAWDPVGDGRTVFRGGGGLYYDQVFLNVTFNQIRSNSGQQVTVTTFNSTRDPNFVNDPLGGRTFDDFRNSPGTINVSRIAEDAEQPHVWSWSIGVARQLFEDLAVTADVVTQSSDSMLRSIDSNLFCCLGDGNAIPIRTGVSPELGGSITSAGRPDQRFNVIQDYATAGKSRYHGLQVGVDKRMRHGYQFGLSYLVSRNRDDHNGAFSYPNNMFNIADEYSDSLQDQRHRFVANWVAELPGRLTFGGIFFAGSGRAIGITTGGADLNGDGTSAGDRPTCGRIDTYAAACAALGVPDGQRVPRNALRSDPVYRLDLRLSRKIGIGANWNVEPQFEVFNVLNRRNYDPTTYNASLASPRFGQPGRSAGLPYLPRQMQVGVRMTF
jgi:hypothetical protein